MIEHDDASENMMHHDTTPSSKVTNESMEHSVTTSMDMHHPTIDHGYMADHTIHAIKHVATTDSSNIEQ